jgi:hypothetical protein
MIQVQYDAERNTVKCTISGLLPDITNRHPKFFQDFLVLLMLRALRSMKNAISINNVPMHSERLKSYQSVI